MKNKQKVWIRGVEGRGEEVLNALKAVGGKLTHGSRLSGEDDTCIYSITHKGFLCAIPAELEVGKIVMDCYREIKLQKTWARGTVLFSPLHCMFAICSGKEDTQYGNVLASYVFHDNYMENDRNIDKRYYHVADKMELSIFTDLLHSLGYDFDFKTKKVVKWQWRPKDGERFYTIASDGQVVEVDNYDKDSWKPQFDFGNCFRTAQEAAEASKKVWEVLRSK